MTRINNDFLDCVIYLYPSVEYAQRGERAGGTGFLLAVPSGALPGMTWLYAITNSHVIREGNSPVVRLNTAEGATQVLPFTCDEWLHHPEGDDLAIASVPARKLKEMKWKFVPVEMLITEADVAKYNVGPGDDVFMVGRFVAHDGVQRNMPSVRFGNISMMPSEPVVHPTRGIKQESFLVEMRSIGGYSGSPVFTYQPGTPRGTVLLEGDSSKKMPDFLLGVDWSHMHTMERVREKDGKTLTPQGWVVQSNSGQMAVIPAWRLRQLVDTETLAKAREEADSAARELIRRNRAGLAGGEPRSN